MYETYNYLNQNISEKNKISILDYEKYLSSIFPIIPHLASECLENLNLNVKPSWPSVDMSDLEEESISFVIQVNGKKRGIIQTKKDISEKELLEEIKKNKSTKKIIENKNISKVLYVRNRLINILI